MCHFLIFLTAPIGEPQNFTIIKVTSNGISFSWQPPLIHLRNGNITHYFLRCSYDNLTRFTFFKHLLIQNTTYTLSNLLPYTNYFCNVSASTNGGEGPSTNNIVTRTDEDSKTICFVEKGFLFLMCLLLGPGSPPLNLSINAFNSSMLLLSWSPPLIPNGIIIKYTINCIGENNKNHTVVTSTTMTLVSDLSPYTNYTCSVFGHTRVGMGPPITRIGLTDEDSECI